MRMAQLKAVCLGEFTAATRQLLTTLQTNQLLEVSYEADFERFVKAPATSEIELVVLECTPESRSQISRLRSVARRIIIIWIGKSFSKEDLIFALDHRIFLSVESLRPDDKRLVAGLRRLAQDVERIHQFEQVIRALKSVLLQSEADVPRAILSEIKAAIAKLEGYGLRNEFTVGLQENNEGEMKLPFHQSQTLSDALITVHDLERTGILWVRGALPQQEGKIEFIQGKIVSVLAGDVTSLKAIYRMFLWDTPKFMFTRREADDAHVDALFNVSLKYVCEQGEQYKARYELIRRELPPADLSLVLETNSLRVNGRLEPHQFSTLASVVEFKKVSQVIDYNTLPDVTIYEALIQLRRSKMIRVAK